VLTDDELQGLALRAEDNPDLILGYLKRVRDETVSACLAVVLDKCAYRWAEIRELIQRKMDGGK